MVVHSILSRMGISSPAPAPAAVQVTAAETQVAAPSSEAAPAEAMELEAPAPQEVQLCTIAAAIEKPSLASGAEHKSVIGMVSLTAPEDATDSNRRPALDIIACVDRSGSMGGPKMNLMQDTLKALVSRAGLKASDRVGIVSFDHCVKQDLELTSMDTDGKQRAQGIIEKIRPGGQTNISGGLLKAIDGFNTKEEAGRNRVVLLFTDGQANVGITSTAELEKATQGALNGTSTKLFTLGFGSDHNEDMLRSIATAGNGLYYFINKTDDIPTAFADCLGGVMSVVAQNAVLTIEAPSPGTAAIGKVLAASYKVLASDATRLSIDLGDLYSEDNKDILFELTLPALAAPHDAPLPALRATLRYFSVAASSMQEASAEMSVARPLTTPEGQPINIKIDEQRNRIHTAEAMEQASRLADAGNVAEGRKLLDTAWRAIQKTASVEQPLSQCLMEEIKNLEAGYEDQVAYRSMGQKMTKMSAMSHMRQRGNHHSTAVYSAGSKSKGMMKKRMFAGSLIGGSLGGASSVGDGDDSD